jgi:hypothetical protein
MRRFYVLEVENQLHGIVDGRNSTFVGKSEPVKFLTRAEAVEAVDRLNFLDDVDDKLALKAWSIANFPNPQFDAFAYSGAY